MENDPYRGTNPWSLARYIRNPECPCPICGGPTRLTVDLVPGPDGDPVLSIFSRCSPCGKDTEMTAEVLEDMDIVVKVASTGEVHETDMESYGIRKDIEKTCTDDSEGKRKVLSLEGRLAGRLAETRRPAAAVSLGRKVIDGLVALEDYDGAMDQAMATAAVLSDKGDYEAALELYGSLKQYAEGNVSPSAIAFTLAHAFALFSSGDTKESTRLVRETVTATDRMKSNGTIPEKDRLVRSRAYEALGVLLSAKNDKAGSMKAMKKALEDSQDIVSKEPSEDGFKWVNRCAREYAFSAFQADMKKRSVEALKDSVKQCSRFKDTYPSAYCDALLQRAMYISDSGSDVPPYLRGDMDEVISMLDTGKDDGRFDPLLPLAYFYRSMTGMDKEVLDGNDMGKAYELLFRGVSEGFVPDSTLIPIASQYVTYLSKNDKEKEESVRKELAALGLFLGSARYKP